MKIRSMQTCIMSSLPRCIFRCSVFRYVTLVSFSFSFFFVQTLLFNCNSFTLVANKYILTYLDEIRVIAFMNGAKMMSRNFSMTNGIAWK